MRWAVVAVVCSSVALGQGPLEPERVHRRAAWVESGGLAIATGGAVVLALGLAPHEQKTTLVVGGTALLALGLQVAVLAGIALLWPEQLPRAAGFSGAALW